MMADPTGTSGLPITPQSDLALATQGGPKFMDRLHQLADATDRHEQAFAKFRVGRDIAAAHAEAAAKLASAAAAEKAANDALAKAKSDAAAMVADAKKTVSLSQVLHAEKREAAEAAAAKVTADADAYAERVRGDAGAALAAGVGAMRAAKEAQKRADDLTAVATARMRVAEQCVSEANAKEADFKARIDRLNAAVRGAT